jgi:aspartyl-tRNA(Asn)/glutamyl-tRNA(Gln) amidotransferase subunit C
MTLSLEEVEHIAELAKLALTDEEKSRFREQLSSILDYANSLQALDTSDIPPNGYRPSAGHCPASGRSPREPES